MFPMLAPIPEAPDEAKKPRELLRGEVGSPDASRATGREGDKQQKIKINKKPRAPPALRLKASHPKAHRVWLGRTLPYRAAVPDAQTFATSPINPSWDCHRPLKTLLGSPQTP